MQFERRERTARAIPLTPLIDVVFLLIVFFMLSTSFVMSESLELSLPKSGAAPAPSDKLSLIRIRIAAGDLLYMDDVPVARALLEKRLFAYLGDNPDAAIRLETANGVSVQELVSVMDIVYFAGGKNVSVAKWNEDDGH